MENVKEELSNDVKAEIAFRNRDSPCSLWEGEMKVKLEKENREILVPVQIFHKDDAKNGQKLFDWTTGKKFIKLFITNMQIDLGTIFLERFNGSITMIKKLWIDNLVPFQVLL